MWTESIDQGPEIAGDSTREWTPTTFRRLVGSPWERGKNLLRDHPLRLDSPSGPGRMFPSVDAGSVPVGLQSTYRCTGRTHTGRVRGRRPSVRQGRMGDRFPMYRKRDLLSLSLPTHPHPLRLEVRLSCLGGTGWVGPRYRWLFPG